MQNKLKQLEKNIALIGGMKKQAIILRLEEILN